MVTTAGLSLIVTLLSLIQARSVYGSPITSTAASGPALYPNSVIVLGSTLAGPFNTHPVLHGFKAVLRALDCLCKSVTKFCGRRADCIINHTSISMFVSRWTILQCINISATILSGAPGSTIAACSGCPNGSTWEVQAAISNGLNVEIASDFVRFDGIIAIHNAHQCIVAC